MNPYLILDNFLSKEKCDELVNLSESIGYSEADLSLPGGPKMIKNYRNNSRVLYRSEELRKELEYMILPFAPKTLTFIKEGGILEYKEFLKLSGNFRFYKYQPGEEFKMHRDGNNLEEGGVSLVTILLYLNDAELGGETNLCDNFLLEEPILVKPETGKLLMFEHTVMHSGLKLEAGVKYILRTDLIYNA
jgi:hypothetical protein